MSYTEIMCFNKKGKSYSYSDYKNAWKFGYDIWEALFNKYISKNNEKFNVFDKNQIAKVWDLEDNENVSLYDMITLMTTFDYFAVKRKNILKVKRAFKLFLKDTLSNKGSSNISNQIKDLGVIYNNNNVIAIGWHVTSVSCIMWNDYNILSDDKHTYIFDKVSEDLVESLNKEE